MKALRLFGQITAFYVAIGLVVWLLLTMFPNLREFLPIGGVERIITKPDTGGALEGNEIPQAAVRGLGESLVWLAVAVIGAFLTALPVSWVYMGIRSEDEYDQSLISTIIILPMVVTSIVVVVQNSLSLAFALGGIAGAVRFKNSLKSSGDALFILLSVGMGLSAGIAAVELAIVMSMAFNYVFLLLWWTEYGERSGMKRYLSDCDPATGAVASAAPIPTAAPNPPTTPPPGA
ncbi:MAG: hypothetical protein ACR2FK_01260 [Sphingomicrobium sp.]